MKDSDFEKLIKLKISNGWLCAVDHRGFDFTTKNEGREVYVIPATDRDLSFHACYHVLMQWIWEQLPPKFKQERCPKQGDFYKYMKVINGNYQETLIYKDVKYLELDSISFGKMSQERFESFVNEQLISLHDKILVPLNMEHVLDEANEQFKKIFNQLI